MRNTEAKMIAARISARCLAGLFPCFLSSVAQAVGGGTDPSPPPPPAAQPAAANDQANTSGGKSKTVTNDKTNYQGDRVSFQRDMIVEVEAADQTVLKVVCLPR